jgi:nanoRNase/pAp phosphatase (c-di-AMP/oligoRNAs hydrolase)
MFFAIKVKTQGLTRNVSSADVTAYLDLHSQIEPKILSRVENPKIPQADYSGFVSGILNARVFGKAMVVNLNWIHRPGLTADLANYLIRMERIVGVFCTGIHKGKLYVSLRIDKRRQDANLLLHNIVDELALAGGDRHSADASIPLKEGIAQKAYREGQMIERFLSLLGQESEDPSALIR